MPADYVQSHWNSFINTDKQKITVLYGFLSPIISFIQASA